MSKKPSGTPVKRASAKKAAKAIPATPKSQKAASAPVGACAAHPDLVRVGKGRGVMIETATEADHADLAETNPAQ